MYIGLVDLTGRTFGRLTVLSYVHHDSGKNRVWNCLCECGTEKHIRTSRLTAGVKSCGCNAKYASDNFGLPWREEDDDYLRLHYQPSQALSIAKVLGRTASTVQTRAGRLGLSRFRSKGKVPRSLWIAIASEEAVSAGLNPIELMAGSKSHPYIVPRWRAWKRLHSQDYSLAQIGVVSGHDHTSVRHGLLNHELRGAGLSSRIK